MLAAEAVTLMTALHSETHMARQADMAAVGTE